MNIPRRVGALHQVLTVREGWITGAGGREWISSPRQQPMCLVRVGVLIVIWHAGTDQVEWPAIPQAEMDRVMAEVPGTLREWIQPLGDSPIPDELEAELPGLRALVAVIGERARRAIEVAGRSWAGRDRDPVELRRERHVAEAFLRDSPAGGDDDVVLVPMTNRELRALAEAEARETGPRTGLARTLWRSVLRRAAHPRRSAASAAEMRAATTEDDVVVLVEEIVASAAARRQLVDERSA